MNPQKSMLLLLAIWITSSTAWCENREATMSPEALISRSRLEQDLWIDGTPPMTIRAELQISDGKNGMVHGDYTLDWVSPSQWREEIRFANYARIRVRETKGYWQTSGLSYRPEVIFQLDKLLHVEDAVSLEDGQTFGRLRNEKNAGFLQNCAEVKAKSGIDRVMCFDEANGALASIEYPTNEHQTPPEISRIEYSGFNAVGGKLVPYEIRALRDRKVVAAVKIIEITKVTGANPLLFAVPANAEFWTQCNDMQEAEVVESGRPRYPTSAKTNHEQGRVIAYAVIEADGSLSHIAIIQRAAPDLEAAALEGFRQRHYKPAACGQMPIRVETSVATDFSLSIR